MIDVKQNRDLIIVYCDRCASKLHFYASNLTESVDDAIRGCGWQANKAKGKIPGIGAWSTQEQVCRACIRKEKGKGRRD